MFDEETEKRAKKAGLKVWFPKSELRKKLDHKVETVRIGNAAGVPSVPNVLAPLESYGDLAAKADKGCLVRRLFLKVELVESKSKDKSAMFTRGGHSQLSLKTRNHFHNGRNTEGGGGGRAKRSFNTGGPSKDLQRGQKNLLCEGPCGLLLKTSKQPPMRCEHRSKL